MGPYKSGEDKKVRVGERTEDAIETAGFQQWKGCIWMLPVDDSLEKVEVEIDHKNQGLGMGPRERRVGEAKDF